MAQRQARPVEFNNRLVRLLPGVYYTLRQVDTWEVASVTKQTEALFGFTSDEVCNMSKTFLGAIIHPEDIEVVRETKTASKEEGVLYSTEFRIQTKRQEIKYVRDQYTCYFDEEGVWTMEGYINEIPQTEVRDRLFQQLQAYRNAVDVNMISSITDRKGKIVYANENFCRVSGYAMWELVGQNHRIINSGYHSKEFFNTLWQTISKGNVWQGEVLNRAKDGTQYWVDTVVIPIFDEKKRIVNYLSLRTLINDRKSAEANRKNYTKLLEELAWIVAHEVRGPLCSILGLTNVLLHYSNTPHEVERSITYLHDSALRLNEITRKLTEFVNDHEIESEQN